jgi:hypothetical protein
VSAISYSQSNGRYGLDSGSSGGGPSRAAIRPIEASKAGIRNGLFTSSLVDRALAEEGFSALLPAGLYAAAAAALLDVR